MILGNHWNKFAKTRPCLNNLVSFYNETIEFAQMERSANMIYPKFSEGFTTLSHATDPEVGILWPAWVDSPRGKKMVGQSIRLRRQ